MDVTPPPAAGKSTRRPESPSATAQPTGAALVFRRAGIAVAGLAVAALAAAACALSFDALRGLAVTGGARTNLAYLYPAGFDALLAIALISVPLLRHGRLHARLQAGIILAALIVAAAAANLAVATGFTVNTRQAAVAVAVAPWVMLVIGLWLFLLPAGSRKTVPAAADDTEHVRGDDHERVARDIVPFGHEERDPGLAPPLETAHAPALERDFAPYLETVHTSETEITPVVPPTPAPETPTVDELPPLRGGDGGESGESGGAARPGEPSDRVPAPRPGETQPGTSGKPAVQGPGQAPPKQQPVPPKPRPAPRSRHAIPEPTSAAERDDVPGGGAEPAHSEEDAPLQGRHEAHAGQGSPSAGYGQAAHVEGQATPVEEAVRSAQEHAVPEPEPEQRLVPRPRVQMRPSRPERNPDMPLRWGDLVRPTTGDVLVHPLPKPAREGRPGDTQPHPQITEPAAGGPGGEESGTDSPSVTDDGPDTQPYPHLRDEAAPLPSTAREAADASPDPAHEAGSADEEESAAARRRPFAGETTAPPSGRMRSTPLPPEE